METMRDLYSNSKFYLAFEPQDVAAGASRDGIQIDRRGYGTVLFLVATGDFTGGGAMSADCMWYGFLEHGLLESDSGASAWSEVPGSQMIHDVYGVQGAYSTTASGRFCSIFSTGAGLSATYGVQYIGKARYVRIRFSDTGTASTISAAAICLLTNPGDWPVATHDDE